MSLQIEKLENNMARLTFETDADELEKALQNAYNKQKKNIQIAGFRKGKVPRQMIEKMYGPGVFYEDAANELIPIMVERELDATDEIEVVSRPEVSDVNIEKGKPFSFVATAALKPPVELGKYKGVKVSVEKAEVTDDEVTAEIDKERDKNSRIVEITDRAVKDGDMISLDFEGFVDDVAFDGGKGENYPLTIGSGSFIPGFEDQLIGANIGEEVTVNVTFPEEYQEKSLAGKDAKFICTVNEIREKELPELDDEFAQDVADKDTVEEYKAHIREKLLADKEAEIKREKEDKVIDAIVEDSKMDIPQAMIDFEAEKSLRDHEMNLSMQGLSLDQYMKYTGLTTEKLLDQLKPQAEKTIKGRLVLEAVAEAEGMSVSDEDFEAELAKMSQMYNMEVDKMKELLGDSETKNIKKDALIRKAIDFVRDNAVEE